ncbi:hypothetical protein B0I00_0763 [Novosphingobium kunmingense]|uniref:Uncharacterized protein n=1 Tax=Novosphingobium kunmingense TaxID=1211806 RepID=A0A2N0I318_9SPHN|nr:hypothetical protein [Novosphingobium kunmingense]PKB25561.1 hypothetical protein B0I00_0763 [Novosphingobium kunmingense]
MRKALLGLLLVPNSAVAASPDEQAVHLVLAKMIVGETLPPEILDRQLAAKQKFPDLDETVAKVKGCKVFAFDRLMNGSYGVQFKCKGLRPKDQPSAMIIYPKDGQVTRITTAFLSNKF